ncbi:MAG: hypothetical protein GX220_03065 [Treponema sp.]|nr:hypothetical protein [Treponema sp.]
MTVFTWNEIINANSENNTKVKDFFTKPSALTIGKFDGAHLGHRALFKAVKDYCKTNTHKIKQKLSGAVIVFMNIWPLITTLKQRLDILEEEGFDFCIVIDFSGKFSKMKGRDFLDKLRKICSMQFIATGSDFRCGHNLDTGVAEISAFCRQYDLEYCICQHIYYSDRRISSSFIKDEILRGNLELVQHLLLKYYTIDALKFRWQTNLTESFLTITTNITEVQVMPPSKAYEAQIICNDTKASVLQCILYVESNFLRLEIPLDQISNFIDEYHIIQFIVGIKIIRSK